MVAQPSQPLSNYMTVDEWRELQRTSHDVKYEYLDGQVYAMAGGTLNHGSMGINACSILRDKLEEKGSPCRVYNSDVAVRLSPGHFTLPDATVTCDERDRGRVLEIQSPRVILEVLSNSTEARDRGEKFRRSREHPSVQEYVLVSTKYQLVELYRRSSEGWVLHVYGPGETVELASLGISFPLAALYKYTDVPETFDLPEGEV
ncbi:MAG TPA: Uma2 family endonuclease [Ktedonobacteraceae bacterium]|nr:Uma2 family endonuclease [Ktedonobacteraceae bacterium]